MFKSQPSSSLLEGHGNTDLKPQLISILHLSGMWKRQTLGPGIPPSQGNLGAVSHIQWGEDFVEEMSEGLQQSKKLNLKFGHFVEGMEKSFLLTPLPLLWEAALVLSGCPFLSLHLFSPSGDRLWPQLRTETTFQFITQMSKSWIKKKNNNNNLRGDLTPWSFS